MSSSKYTDARIVRFQTVNPFEALAEGDGKSSSGGSSDSSGSVKNAGVALSTPSRQAQSLAQSDEKHHAVTSSQQVPSVSDGAISSRTNMASTITSPFHNNGNKHTVQKTTYKTPRHTTTYSAIRKSSSGSARHSRSGSGRKASSGSHSKAPYGASKADSLVGISEGLTVQELAFRQGQRDHESTTNTVPPSPFRRQFDQLWVTFYELGRHHGGSPLPHPTPANAEAHLNYAWSVLINPYTQSLDAPNGILDLQWTRRVCEMSLECMDALIRVVCKRGSGWEKTVVDVPMPVTEALVQFPDLAEHYEALKNDAREALSGGRPYGY